MKTISVLYKCSCMPQERAVEVAERRAGEDVCDWVTYVQHALAADHRMRSPECLATVMEYAKIPCAPDGEGIGYVGMAGTA